MIPSIHVGTASTGTGPKKRKLYCSPTVAKNGIGNTSPSVQDTEPLTPTPLPFPFLSRNWYTSRSSKRSESHSVSDKIPDDKEYEKLQSEQPQREIKPRKKLTENKTDSFLPSCKALPFPRMSKKWYSSITDCKSSGYEEDNVSASLENQQILVFPRISKEWYKRRGKLSLKNNNRKRSVPAEGYIQKNVEDLEKKVKNEVNRSLKEKYRIILEVGKYFLSNGPIIAAKQLGTVYNGIKEKITNIKLNRTFPKPTKLLAVLLPHLSICKIKLHETTFFVEKREQVNPFVQQLEDLSNSRVRKEI